MRVDMNTKTPLKLVGRCKPRLVLKRVHIDILTNLRDCGSAPASLFDEEALDELFKERPRLIDLVRGHVKPIVEITIDGIIALTSRNGKTKHS